MKTQQKNKKKKPKSERNQKKNNIPKSGRDWRLSTPCQESSRRWREQGAMRRREWGCRWSTHPGTWTTPCSGSDPPAAPLSRTDLPSRFRSPSHNFPIRWSSALRFWFWIYCYFGSWKSIDFAFFFLLKNFVFFQM